MSSVETLRVALGERSYDIIIGSQLLGGIGNALKNVVPERPMFIITDEHIAEHHLETLEVSLTESGIIYESIILPAGEGSKNFATFEQVVETILEQKPERGTTLLAFGGGVIGDLTGYAASSILRGIHFVQIPTTLLAQVDSSVGGKTGINSKMGKNLIGAFYQPKLVLADISLLETLPKREYLAGYAEVVKYGLINNAEFFAYLEEHIDAVTSRDPSFLQQAVLTSCQSKADIVAQDEREGGVRALLNLGHTFGHALEADTGFSELLNHGEAVALGMQMAFALSVKQGICKQQDLERIISHMQAVGLPTTLQDVRKDWDAKRLLQYMYSDKKVSDGELVLILARGIGESFIARGVLETEIIEVLEEYCA